MSSGSQRASARQASDATEIRDMSPTNSGNDMDAMTLPVIEDTGHAVLQADEWVPVEVDVALDSGCTNHVLDAEDAPGYTVMPFLGSRRGHNFVVGHGARVPNEGEVHLNLEAPAGEGAHVPIQTHFQVAEINRPLMSVSRICDQGFTCVFTKEGASILDSQQRTLWQFGGSDGLYVASMKLKPPEPFTRQAP